MNRDLRIFSGISNPDLSKEICDFLGVSLGKVKLSKFSDGENLVQVEENVRGMDIFIIQSTSSPVNDHLIELLLMVDTMKRASAYRITTVIPYMGYARQDRKDQPRVPISAKLVADLITTAGAHRVLTMDLHAGQIQGFFNIPVDHLYATPVLLEYLKSKNFEDPVVVSPDAGGVERARAFAKRLNAQLAIIDKRREGPNQVKFMNIIGEVEKRNVILLDDMIDTAGTISQSANALREKGASEILAACSHPVLSGSALDLLRDSCISEIIVTNTIPLGQKKDLLPKIKVLSVAPLLGEAIRRIHNEDSVSSLFV